MTTKYWQIYFSIKRIELCSNQSKRRLEKMPHSFMDVIHNILHLMNNICMVYYRKPVSRFHWYLVITIWVIKWWLAFLTPEQLDSGKLVWIPDKAWVFIPLFDVLDNQYGTSPTWEEKAMITTSLSMGIVHGLDKKKNYHKDASQHVKYFSIYIISVFVANCSVLDS